MEVKVNQEVGTSRGNGVVIGQSVDGRIIVRQETQQAVTKAEKGKTFNGWQFEYPTEDLTAPEAKRKG